jgi:DNA-binding transcriptional LysR family regulator
LLEDPFVVACTSEHPLARHKQVSWNELAQHDFISLAQGSGNRFLLDQALAKVARKPDWLCEVHHVPALVSLVEAGLGIGIVPRLALPPRGKLVSVELVEPTLTRTIGIIRRRGRPLRAPAEHFQRLLLEYKPRQAPGAQKKSRQRTGS